MVPVEGPDPQYLTFSYALSREITEIQSQNTRPILVCRFPHLITIRNTGEELSGLIIISLCFIILETGITVSQSATMKRIFGRSGGKEREEEIQAVSLDIVLANKEDIITKVAPAVLPPCSSVSKYIYFQLKNEYKSFLSRKVEIERDLVEVESQEVELR